VQLFWRDLDAGAVAQDTGEWLAAIWAFAGGVASAEVDALEAEFMSAGELARV
jgi:hypothetical protein